MKNIFVTGIILLLPVILTIAILAFILNLFTDPFLHILDNLSPTNTTSHAGLKLLVRLFILASFILFTILVGYLMRTFFMHSFVKYSEKMIKKIPFVNSIYNASQEVIKTVFSSEATSFKQVVIVPHPQSGTLSLGFITGINKDFDELPALHDKVPVFVTGALNPTMGFLIFYPKDQVRYIDMPVEDAFKTLVSCGMITAKE